MEAIDGLYTQNGEQSARRSTRSDQRGLSSFAASLSLATSYAADGGALAAVTIKL